MTFVYTTISYSCYTSLTLQLQYSCYLISCYRAQKVVHVLGEWSDESIKVLAPTRQPLWPRKTQMFPLCEISFPFKSNFQLKLHLWSNLISKFSATFLSLTGGWLWWDKDSALCSSFTRFLLKPKCKESCGSLHSCFTRVSITQNLKLFIQNSFTLFLRTQYRIHCWRGFED